MWGVPVKSLPNWKRTTGVDVASTHLRVQAFDRGSRSLRFANQGKSISVVSVFTQPPWRSVLSRLSWKPQSQTTTPALRLGIYCAFLLVIACSIKYAHWHSLSESKTIRKLMAVMRGL
jgi:hypothetical protein